MKEFILEEKMEKVVNPRTKEYLAEVVSSYRNGNYRASVVVLYTTVIFDLMQKLITLKDIYDDKNAKKIYEDIKIKWKEKPSSSEWEEKLIGEIENKTCIISAVEKEELLHLKKERNYAAHPIMSGDNYINLKHITKETAADLIRKAFEIVFLKDTILAKNINKEITADLKEYYSILREDRLEEYLRTKYFSKMTQPRKDALFKFLWKCVFILNDEEHQKNRYSHFLALSCLYKESKDHYLKLISDDEDAYLNKITYEIFESTFEQEDYKIIKGEMEEFQKSSRIINFIRFIEDYPEIYRYLNDYTKNILQASIKKMYTRVKSLKKEQYRLEATAVFLSDDITTHFDELYRSYGNDLIFRSLSKSDLSIILHQAEYRGCVDEFKNFLMDYCLCARSFQEAENVFMYIELCKRFYTESDYRYILIKMDRNSQIYNNFYCNGWLTEIKVMYEENFGSKLISTNEERVLYPNLFRNIKPENYNIEKVLELIEKRLKKGVSYSSEDLERIFSNISIDETELTGALKQKNPEDYPHILSGLEERGKAGLDYFTKLFNNDKTD